MRIAIDPGHGGLDVGAVGPTGFHESRAAYEISCWLEQALTKLHHEVFLTRAGDVFVSLEHRCVIANEGQADAFISIHCNAFSNPAAHGYEVWTSRGDTGADEIAERIFNSIGAAFPNLTPRFDLSDGDHDKEAGFAVLVGTHMPAVLVETAFISNPLEERWLRDVGWQMRMAGAIASGIGR